MDWTMVGAFGVLNTTNANIGLTAAAIPEFRAALARALDDVACREDLRRDEALSLSLFYDSLLNVYQQAFRDVSLGFLPERALQDVSSQLLALPYFKDAWPLLRGEYADDFVAFVEARHGVGEA